MKPNDAPTNIPISIPSFTRFFPCTAEMDFIFFPIKTKSENRRTATISLAVSSSGPAEMREMKSTASTEKNWIRNCPCVTIQACTQAGDSRISIFAGHAEPL